MINPNDLQRGNLLRDHLGRIGKVVEISNSYIETEHAKLFLDEALPNPLNIGWIREFGFSLSRNDRYYIEYKIKVELGWDDILEEENYTYCRLIKGKEKKDIWHYYFDGVLVIPCNFVHQLQNGFYALWGKELTVKEI